ncbi:hypothetical protein SLA2020_403920 [Shorea laevis]
MCNLPHHNKVIVTKHLLNYGFMNAYSVWWAHGETLSGNVDPWLAICDVHPQVILRNMLMLRMISITWFMMHSVHMRNITIEMKQSFQLKLLEMSQIVMHKLFMTCCVLQPSHLDLHLMIRQCLTG